MEHLANILVGFVALIHAGILVAEMFLWRVPLVHRLLGFTRDQANATVSIMANVGLYNGFLVAGLVWGLVGATDPLAVKTFFLSCVAIAGVFGSVTVKWTTIVVQTVPASAALVALWAT